MKHADWTGDGNSIYKTLGASNHTENERETYDYYATEPKAAELLCEVESLSPGIWECACGEGHLAEVLRKRGHICDIIEPSGGHPEWHILGDALAALNGGVIITMDGVEHDVGKWDMLIAHPPCTYLSNVATRQYSLKCTPAQKVIWRWEQRAKAAIFFMHFALSSIPYIAVENPVGFMNSAYRKPDQIIHPYYFADSEDDAENYHKKRTCLWLKGLSPLKRAKELPAPPPMYISQGRKPKKIGWCEGMRGTTNGQEGRARARSKSFPGIAKAMAEQWG